RTVQSTELQALDGSARKGWMAAAHEPKNPRRRIGAREKCGGARGFAPLTKAGLKVWYDHNLVSGPVASTLGVAIDTCKAAVIVPSEHSLRSRWVEAEYNLLEEERATSDFRIATIR